MPSSPGRRRAPYQVPSRHDPVVGVAARTIGGPLGRHARVGAAGLRGVVAMLVPLGAVMLALGAFQKGHCLAKGWYNPDQFWRACYSDVPVVHATTALAQRDLPYLGIGASDQPPLSGLAMWLLSLISPQAGTGAGPQRWVFTLWALATVLLLAAAVVAAVGMSRRDPWQAAHLACSPVLVVLALVSTDLLGIALLLWGLWHAQRDRPALAGALIGLAFLLRPYPAVLLLAIVLVAVRDHRWRDAVRTAAGALAAALALFLPLVLLAEGAFTPLRQWWLSWAGNGALSMLPQLLVQPLTATAATVIALLGWVLALALGWWLARRPERPGVIQVAAPMLLVVALTAKALPVQAGLWVLPLLALSAVPWRDHLIWAAVEIIHFEAVWLHIGFGMDAGKGLPPQAYALLVMLRLAGWTWVLWQVWWHPARQRAPRELTARRSPAARLPVPAAR